MSELFKLIETILLREYIFAHGDTVIAMLDLNVFADLDDENIEDNGSSTTFIEHYQNLSAPIRARIEALPSVPLLPTMIDSLERAYYEGSDAYEEEYEDDLAKIYDRQLKLCKEICDQMEEILKDPTKTKDAVIRAILTTIKENPGSSGLKSQMGRLIDTLRMQGYDYPELDMIEKSIKAG